MKNTILIQAAILLVCLGVFGSDLLAQSATKTSKADFQAAPSIHQPSLNKAPAHSAAYEAKSAQKAAMEESKMQARLKSLSTPPRDVATLQALRKEMDANRSNASYDMERAFRLMKASPLVVYPFQSFDADFPLVIRTGDKSLDAANYNLAKESWANAKKEARMNPDKSKK
ncbi:MAG: hypothetical protein R3C61_14855 [Bacteroidia bacterium]